MLRIAVGGHGYWGPKLARNVAASSACELAAICDVSPARSPSLDSSIPTFRWRRTRPLCSPTRGSTRW